MRESIRDLFVDAAREAGRIALPYFNAGSRTSAGIDYKHEGSPVTDADIAVDRYLETRIKAALPGIGWLSEESIDDPARLSTERVVIVDPIDGTRAFVSGDDVWCICIALVEQGKPVIGVIHAPARKQMFVAIASQGAFLNGERLHGTTTETTRRLFAGPLSEARRLVSDAEAAELAGYRKVPSLAYRLMLVATGEIGIAGASKAAHDWDIAAADVILTEAGCALRDRDGRALVYNRPIPVHPALVAAHASRFTADQDHRHV
jgi:myo-inositol-1(or 4)-monophosphatase